ncbi:MAG TPA: phage integrase N-terminal SAM-like domain-containing protein [Polyangia bacterium]|jgi:hypothetical protein|nr:phage integrase N-terminal SAM-like domain-containing protein [Polyangia bacterium]
MAKVPQPDPASNIIIFRPVPESTRRPPQRVQLSSGIEPTTPLPAGQSPRLLDRVRSAARVRHLSHRTEKAYVGWIKRFIIHHRKRHPSDMGGAEVGAFLSSLATDHCVSASTQNQALAALLFLYQVVLGIRLP